jgi:hypothetical protein
MTDRALLLAFRQALLMMVDAIERKLEIKPRTSEIKRIAKRGHIVYNIGEGELQQVGNTLSE